LESLYEGHQFNYRLIQRLTMPWRKVLRPVGSELFSRQQWLRRGQFEYLGCRN
jgi:hypothetical protein